MTEPNSQSDQQSKYQSSSQSQSLPAMSATSRIGRKISRRACDFCRDRRVQCTFEEADSASCRQCRKSRASCTFLTQRKPRGPRRSRYEPAVIDAAFALTKINNSSNGNDRASSTDPKAKNGRSSSRDGADDSNGRVSIAPEARPIPALAPASGPRMTTTTTTTTTTTAAIGRTVTTGPTLLPIGIPSVEHLVSEAVFRIILDEYVNRVYPVIPLVHLPTFASRLQTRDFATDPVFFRLCMAICAVTVASIPRNGGTYGAPWYRGNNVADMIDRAAHLIMLSLMTSTPGWQNTASVDGILLNVLLALAFHYSDRQNAGWTYSSNAMLAFRTLELYKKESYAEMSTVDAEMIKRAFWLMFIMQIHDRMSYVYPHMGLNCDPKHTDWEFLLPLDVEDEALISPLLGSHVTKSASGNSLYDPVAGNRRVHSMASSDDGSANGSAIPAPRLPPTISGFIALIKVFLCVADLLDTVFPGPPARFSLSPGPQALQAILPTRKAGLFEASIVSSVSSSYSYSFFFPQTRSASRCDASPSPADPAPKQPRSDVNMLDSLFQVMARLNTVLGTLPDELRPIRTPEDARRAAMLRHHIPSQFEIMRSNVQITSIYIQSMIIEMCLGKLQCLSGQTEVHSISSFAHPPQKSGPDPSQNPSQNSSQNSNQPHAHKQEHSQFFQEWAERARRIDLVDWSDRGRPDATQQKRSASPAAKAAANDLRSRLWQLKDSVARELLEAITSVPTWVLESNGSSMITKIREIASTLLDDSSSTPMSNASKGNTKGYLAQFVQTLADLDHISRCRV